MLAMGKRQRARTFEAPEVPICMHAAATGQKWRHLPYVKVLGMWSSLEFDPWNWFSCSLESDSLPMKWFLCSLESDSLPRKWLLCSLEFDSLSWKCFVCSVESPYRFISEVAVKQERGRSEKKPSERGRAEKKPSDRIMALALERSKKRNREWRSPWPGWTVN